MRLFERVVGMAVVSASVMGCPDRPVVDPGPTALKSSIVLPPDASACSKAKSDLAPLTAEWTPSEKSRLEEMLGEDRAIVVNYSGCEMKVLERCQVPGVYDFRRTTLSTDSRHATNSEQLVAALPLGAVALTADLQRKGEVAVYTAVDGQHVFSESDPVLPSKTGDCATATHVVRRVSVGAYALVLGSAGEVSGGVNVFNAQTKIGASRSAEVKATSGDPEGCKEAPESGVNQRCNAPVQVFLEPIGTKPHVASLRVSAFIDGRSQLVIKGNTVHWHHVDWAAPGRENGMNEVTYLNGAAWQPRFPDQPDSQNRNCKCDSDTFVGVPSLARVPQELRLQFVSRRDRVEVIQQPDASNDFTAIVELDDSPNGSFYYDLFVFYTTTE